MDNFESIKEKILKVYELVKRGVDGEQSAAQKRLDTLLEKYNITLEDILSEEKKEYRFKKGHHHDKSILFQCLAKFTTQDTYTKYHRKGYIDVELTKVEYLDLSEALEFYKKLYRKEIKTFLSAFIYKHNIFGPVDENAKEEKKRKKKKDDIDIYQMIQMMAGMSNEIFQTQKEKDRKQLK